MSIQRHLDKISSILGEHTNRTMPYPAGGPVDRFGEPTPEWQDHLEKLQSSVAESKTKLREYWQSIDESTQMELIANGSMNNFLWLIRHQLTQVQKTAITLMN